MSSTHTLSARDTERMIRVSAPADGEHLPVVVLSHGFGSSMDGYGPLADHWAAHGFVVVQPTHLDAALRGLAADDPRAPTVWRTRIADLRSAIDDIEALVAAVPGLAGRVDHDRIAIAGHSYGATSASALLGARVLAPAGDPDEDFTDPRVSAGVLLCVAGVAGDDLTPVAEQRFPFMRPSFDTLARPALIGAGDADQSPLSTRGPDWWTDAHRFSPGPTELLVVPGAEHDLGGIDGPAGGPHVTAEQLANVALVQRATTAYLRAALS